MKKNEWIEYSEMYKCSIAEAIADRDYPATLETCVMWFKESTGHNPSANEISIMRPDTAESVSEENEFVTQDYR